MTKKKYDYKVTDIELLQKIAPNAVIVEKKAVRSAVTKLLDCGISPEHLGIEIVDRQLCLELEYPEVDDEKAA